MITIRQYVFETQQKYASASGAFTALMEDLILAAKLVSREINKAGLVDILGLTGETNPSGDEIQKLDHFANQTFIECLSQGGRVSALISEELDEIYPIQLLDTKSKYILTMDPLDGSSNIDVNVSVGSIFGIYRRLRKDDPVNETDFFQPGKQLVAAGYVIYGSSTMFVFTTGAGVQGFTLDPSVGEFLLSHPDIRMPQRGKYYSVNESNTHTWRDCVYRYIQELKKPENKYSARYIGSLVADFHRNLLKGGVFAYPAARDGKGKLRLLYEAIPMAFLAEHAGGEALDGKNRILDLTPKNLHERVSLFIGSKQEMALCRLMLSFETRTAAVQSKITNTPQ